MMLYRVLFDLMVPENAVPVILSILYLLLQQRTSLPHGPQAVDAGLIP